MNLTGQVILIKTGQATAGLNLLIINPTAPTGIYVLSVQIGELVLTQRLLRY